MVMLCCVVFCKQKTAYEMRISDWSSDVCSSDFVRSLPLAVGRERHWQQLVHDDLADMLMDLLTLWSEICRIARALVGRAVLVRELAGDRQSVVEGKSVSVRVALCGRRTLTKQLYHTTQDKHKQTHK